VIVIEQEFDASTDDLFAVLIDPVTYPEWLVGTKAVRTVSPDWPAPGSSFTHTVGFGPIAVRDRTTAREIDAPRMLELFVRARPAIQAHVRFEIAGVGDRSVLRMTERPVGFIKLLAPVTQPLIRARNERSLHRLRALVHAIRSEDRGPVRAEPAQRPLA
jgi:hypothetical protein